MSKKTTGKAKDDGEKSKDSDSSEGGIPWMGIAGALLIIILAASVYMQPDEMHGRQTSNDNKYAKATIQGLREDATKTTTSRPRKEKKAEVKTTTAAPEEPEPVEKPVEKKRPEPKPPEKRKPDKKKNSKVQQFSLHIPRLTLAELHKNETLKTGHHAFVITDIVNKSWKAINWTLNSLKQKIPFEWVDYYPENMVDMEKKPFLMKLEKAIPDFLKNNGHAKYMQMRISLRGWKRIRKDFDPMPDHPTFWDDGIWIRECMKKDGKPDEKAIDNFFTTNQWKFLLIGMKGTSMFFHKDHTAASSWQAQIMGRKSWTLCPNDQSHYLNPEMNTYKPDYKRFPQFAKALCGQVTVQPGEMVYYPGYMWHHTLQHDTPTISYTGALVGNEAERSDLGGGDTKVHVQFYRDLMHKCKKCWRPGVKERQCDDISLRWPGAAPPMLRSVCDSYLPRCLKLWNAHSASLWQKSEPQSSDDLDSTSDLGAFA